MIRFNPDPIPSMLSLLGQTQRDQNTALEQLSTTRRVNRPSDDPAAAAANVEDIAHIALDDRYIANAETLRELMNTADSTLNSVVMALERAISLGIEGATGTQTAENRSAIADDVLGIRDQVFGLANLSFRGRYVFAGTAGEQPPFILDASSPSGVTYVGNASTSSAPIGEQRTMQTNLPGSQIFMSSGQDVFAGLKSLADALASNSSSDYIGACVANVRSSFEHIGRSRIFYGTAMNQLDSQSSFLQNEKLLIAEHQNQNVGSDPATAASNVQQAQFAREATLQAVAISSRLSLLDYLNS